MLSAVDSSMSRVCHGPWYNVIQIYWMDGWMNEHLGYYRIEWTSRSLSYHKNLSLEMSYTLFWWSWSTSYKFTWEYDHPAHMFPHCIYNVIIKGVFMCFSQVIIQYLWFFSWFISYVTTGCKKEVNMRVYQEIWMRMSIAAYVHQLDYDGDMYMKYAYLGDMYMKTSRSAP